MQERQAPASTESDMWTWIILAGVLVLAAAIGLISMGIMANNEAMKSEAPTQQAPAAK